MKWLQSLLLSGCAGACAAGAFLILVIESQTPSVLADELVIGGIALLCLAGLGSLVLLNRVHRSAEASAKWVLISGLAAVAAWAVIEVI